HHPPVHEIVGVAGPPLSGPAAVIGQHLVAPIEVHYCRHLHVAVTDRDYITVLVKCIGQCVEPAPREHRGSEVAHALAVDAVQHVDIAGGGTHGAGQTALDALAHH